MSDNCDIESVRRIHILLAFYSILERSENTGADIGEGPRDLNPKTTLAP